MGRRGGLGRRGGDVEADSSRGVGAAGFLAHGHLSFLVQKLQLVGGQPSVAQQSVDAAADVVDGERGLLIQAAQDQGRREGAVRLPARAVGLADGLRVGRPQRPARLWPA